jgi:protocatechuate 3,4-dioxygenase beta subunit
VPPQVFTDADGRFAFRSLTRGNYTLNATKSGFSPGGFGRTRPGGPTKPLQLDDGEKLADVTIRIFKLGSISGQVMDEAGEAVVGAQVRLYRRALVAGRRVLTQANGTSTDDRGIYRLASLTAGEYVVVVPMVPVTVPAGGQPNAATRQNLQATASQLSFAAGSSGAGGRQLSENLQFLLQSTGMISSLAAVEDGPGRWRSYATQYYANATTLGGAEPIDLKVGDERVGVDFTMRHVPTANITGQLIAPDSLAGDYLLRLIPSVSGEWTGEPEAALATTDANGGFAFLTIPAGNYVIQTLRVPQQQVQQNVTAGVGFAQSARGSSPPAASYAGMPLLPLHKDPLLWASAPVNVGGDDVNGVVLTLRPGFTVSGRMEFISTAGRARPDPQRMAQIPVSIESADARPIPQNGPPSRVLPDGRFITQSRQPGRYFVRVGGAPPGWMVQSIIINGIDASSVPVELSQDVNNAVIMFTDQISDVRGSVTSVPPGDDPPAVIVFPADAMAWKNFGANPARLRRALAVETNRAFSVGTLPPGDYFIIAIPEDKSADWQDPDFLELLSRQATRFTLSPGERRVMQLPRQDVQIGRLAQIRPRPAPDMAVRAEAATDHATVATLPDLRLHDQPDGSSPSAAEHEPAQAQQTRDTRAPAPVGLGVVSGVITQEDSGGKRPARLARVSLRSSTLQGERTVMTDDEGRYTARWLPPGDYTVQVSKPAYLTMSYGARRSGRPGTTITVDGGKPLTNINVTLPRGAAVGGTVLDHEGQPVINARIQVLQATTIEGQRILNTVAVSGQSTTDDRGAFRLYGLRPGNYSVMVTPPPIGSGSEVRQLSDQDLRAAVAEAGTAPNAPTAVNRVLAPAPAGPVLPVEPAGRAVSYSPIFLPGTTSENDASVIALSAGQELTGLTIVMPLVPAARIEGVVSGLEGQPMNGASVQLQRVMNYPGTFNTNVRMMEGGRFFILGVPPGEYTLSASARHQAPAPPRPATPQGAMFQPPPGAQQAQQLWARQTIYVSGVDQKDLRLALRPPLRITGQLALEGGTLPPKTEVQVRLEQFGRPGTIQSTRVSRVDSGMFSFPNVTPGLYRLTASVPSVTAPGGTPSMPPAQIWGVKTATLNGNDAYEAIVSIGPDAQEISASLTLTNRLPELVGQIQNAKGELVTDMTMVLFSADSRYWTGTSSRRLRTVIRPGTDGQYRFANLLPGDYYLAVLVDVEPAEFNETSFLEQLVPASIKVTLAEGDRKVQAVRVARQP